MASGSYTSCSKHIFDPDLQQLPEIFTLLKALMTKDIGLQYLETMIRYLSSVLEEEELSLKEIKKIADKTGADHFREPHDEITGADRDKSCRY